MKLAIYYDSTWSLITLGTLPMVMILEVIPEYSLRVESGHLLN